MTMKEMATIMGVLAIAYPRYYAGQDINSKKAAVTLWHSILGEYDAHLVDMAVRAVIATSAFPPTPADVIQKIAELQNGGHEMTELEAWGYISRAVRNATYHATEEWERLPAELKKIVSADMLRAWSLVEADNVETVLASNFGRTFRAAKARQKNQTMLPNYVKEYIEQTGGNDDGEELFRMPGKRSMDGRKEEE